jgi:hypothetical protein
LSFECHHPARAVAGRVGFLGVFQFLLVERYMRAERIGRNAMEKLSSEELRALRLLAQYPSGCTEPVILAHGLELDQIANLVFRGFAKREVSNVAIGGRQVKIVRMQITATGRNAIVD